MYSQLLRNLLHEIKSRISILGFHATRFFSKFFRHRQNSLRQIINLSICIHIHEIIVISWGGNPVETLIVSHSDIR